MGCCFSASAMTLKAFIFLTIVWNSSTFASGNNTYHLQFPLGCQAEIPCLQKKRDSNSFKWFYKKDKHSNNIQIFFEDKRGLQHHNSFRRKGSVTHNRAFIIKDFNEDDQGLYWCENCYDDNCKSEESTVIRVTKEILREINDTVYVTVGSSLTYPCPGEFTNYEWTFDASTTTALKNSTVRPETNFGTSNKSMHIVNVKTADAGKYTCWANNCNGHRQKICSVNLCVITVHQSGNSSVSCDVICDVEFKHIRTDSISKKVPGTRTVSVHVNPDGSINCSAKHLYDAYINITHTPTNASIKTIGTNTQHEYLTPVICGTSAAFTCLIFLALCIFYFRPKRRADISNNPSGCDIEGKVDEDSSLVYSSLVFRTPAKTTNSCVNYSECVYSEIKV